jgi:hypothetical protein
MLSVFTDLDTRLRELTDRTVEKKTFFRLVGEFLHLGPDRWPSISSKTKNLLRPLRTAFWPTRSHSTIARRGH